MLGRSALFLLVGTAFFLTQPQFSTGGSIIRPIGRETIEPPAKSGEFVSDVSRRNLLGLERPTPFSLPTAKRGVPLGEALLEDTIRVLALKVEFQTETPDNNKTTGNGNFDMRTFEEFQAQEGHYIDPAPHNSAYFNSHLDALNRYWQSVSDGKLSLSWAIYPQIENEAFRLPVSMSYYGSEGPWADSSVGDKLGHFFIDAIHFADSAAPEINFADFQAIIIFHAGSDQQNNIDFIDDTPDDFWTGFLRLAEPVEVDGGSASVIDGTIMPETVNQDNRLNALNAVMAHEFGHQLGLVDLYRTDNFMTQMGDFSLMDNNGMSVGVIIDDNFPSVGGTIPVYPDAWSRAYLGFDAPRVVTLGENEPVFAAALQHAENEIIKVPITEFEYFLVENRQIDADTLGPGFPFDNVLIGDPQTTVILGPGYAYFQGNDTILVTDAEYDRLLPGNGILIWHVDESVAYLNYAPEFGPNNFWNNALQWDPSRRFVSLVEADGVIDFGGNYYTGFGSQADMFRRFFNSQFTPFTNPSSRSNLGADSHISITDISGSDTVMTSDISIDWFMPGWPQMSIPGSAGDPVVADLDGDDSLEVIMASGNQLLIWRHDGRKFIPNADSIGILRFDRSIAVYPLAVAAECDTDIVGRPVIFQADSILAPVINPMEIAVSTISGSLYVFSALDADGRAYQIPDSPLEGVTSPLLGPMAVNFLTDDSDQLLTVDISGRIHLINWTFTFDYPEDTVIFDLGVPAISACAYSTAENNVIQLLQLMLGGPPRLVTLEANSGSIIFEKTSETPIQAEHIVAGDILRNGSGPRVVASGTDVIGLVDENGIVLWTRHTDGSGGRPALGDINSDGYPEIVVAGDSKIFAFNRDGIVLSDFPIDMNFYDLGGMIQSSPILADVDSDGNPDIITGLPSGAVYAFNYRGDRLAGFPLPSSFGINMAAAVGDLNHDGQTDLLAVESAGFVKAWGLEEAYVAQNAPWPMAGADAKNSGYLSPEFQKPLVTTDEQLPENSVFCYPNPAKNSTTIRYYLNSDSQVSIDIYDYLGERIHKANLVGQAHADNEYIWNCSGAASGVYYCRIQATSAAREVWRMIKIAVVN